MSYMRLAETLKVVGETLVHNERALQGSKLGAAAEKLQAALERFKAVLDDQLRGLDPEVGALRGLLESEAARRVLDVKTLKLLAKQATGKALTVKAADAPQDQRQRFLESALKLRRVSAAREALAALIARAARAAPDPGDREKVLADLWRLGTLGEADLEIERARLVANVDLLRAMAGYAYVRVTARSAPKTIFANLVKFARRVQENTA